MSQRSGNGGLLKAPAGHGDGAMTPRPLLPAAQHWPSVEGGPDGQDSHVRFRNAFDHAPIGMALVSVDGRWLDVNGALCTHLGYGADELLRLRWQDLTHGDDLGAEELLLTNLRSGQSDWGSREKRFIRSDGVEVWVALSVSVVRGSRGGDDYFIQQIQDISARKYADRVFEQQAFISDALNEAAMVTDVGGRIMEWNPSAALMFGLTGGASSESCLSTLLLEHNGESTSTLLDALRGKGRWRGELAVRLAGGEPGMAEITAAAIGAPHGRERAYAVLARDITERYAADRRIRDHNRRLGTLLEIQHQIAHVGPDRNAIRRLVVERVLDLVPCDGAAVALVEEQGMLSVVSSGANSRRDEFSMLACGTPAGICIDEGRILRLSETRDAPLPRKPECGLAGCESAVYIPLLYDGRATGALVVMAADSGVFDDSDIDALQLMAGALAAALRHAARFEENQALFTDRSRAFMALQAGEQRFRALIEHARDIVVVLTVDGTMEYVSPAVTPVLGYPPEELVLRTVGQYLHPDDVETLRAQSQRLLERAGKVGSLDFRFRHRDGSWRQLAGRASNQVDHRALGGLVLNLQDVTDSRRMEAQLRQGQKLEAIGQLAAGIAHEINTPVQYVGDNVRFLDAAFGDMIGLLDCFQRARAVIAAYPELATLSDDLGHAADRADITYLMSEIPTALSQSLEGLERIAEIVRSVKSFSHPGGAVKIAADLNREIESTVSVSRNEWKYVADIELDLASDLPPVHCLVSEVNQVVLNLIVNAAHAIDDRRISECETAKGLITVSTTRQAESVEIRVKDTGAGIPEKVRQRLFDPFFTTKEVGRGTGQGLSLSHMVVAEKHGGSIDFETQLGVGTTFIVRLPIGEPDMAATTEAS